MVNQVRLVLERHGRPILALLLFGFILYYAFTQPRVQFDDGHPYDSQSYYHMAQQVAAGQPIVELRPFATRMALPWLVGTLFPEDLMLGFTVLNLAFATAGLIVLGLYLREFLRDDRLILALLIVYVVNPASPFRFVMFLPAYTDPAALFFMSLLLLLGRRISAPTLSSILLLSTIGFAAALFRELVICAMLVVSFGLCARLELKPPFIRLRSIGTALLALIPVAATLAGIAVANALVESTGGYRYHVQMLGVVNQLLQQASIYPLAWLTAFGAMPLVILLCLGRRITGFLATNQDLLLYLLGMAAVAAVAGFHTDRLVFWCYPALLVLFGKVLESRPLGDAGWLRKMLFFAPLIVVQALSFRVFLPIPQDVNGALQDPGTASFLFFSVYGADANLGQFYAATMLPGDRVTLLIQFCLAAVYFGVVIHAGNRTGVAGKTGKVIGKSE